MKEMKSNNGILGTGIMLSLVTCFMLFLYAPLELYFQNQEEFFYDVYVLIPPIACNFFVFLGVSIVFFLLVRKSKYYYMILCIYFVCFICTYVQGNFLASWLPAIDGNVVVWNEFASERIKSIVLWIITVIGVVIVHN